MKEQVYFVRQLGPESYRPVPEAVYEIQILNEDYQGEQSAYLADESPEILCVVNFATPPGPKRLDPSTVSIPKAVIDAARQRKVGFGERVNEKGEILPLF
jgi:hypothetical protein